MRGSQEDLILDILSDGKAYTQSELEKELRINQRNSHYPSNATDMEKVVSDLNSIKNMFDSWHFESKLDNMEKESKIKSTYVEGKDGHNNKYYMRTEI